MYGGNTTLLGSSGYFLLNENLMLSLRKCLLAAKRSRSLERPTLALRVPLFLFVDFQTNECEVSDFCL